MSERRVPTRTRPAGGSRPARKGTAVAKRPGGAAAKHPSASARTSTTPQTLSRLRALCAALSLLFALITAIVGYQDQAQADAASRDADQYGRIASISAHLVAAQTRAQDEFLAASVPTDDALARDLAGAQDQLVAAAAADRGDAATLRTIAGDVTGYASDLGGALNAKRIAAPGRIGAPDTPGKASLDQAQSLLDGTIQPRLDLVARDAQQRAASHAAGISLWWLVIPGILALTPLIAANVIIARRTHRVINPGLAIATLATAGALALAIGSVSSLQTRMEHATNTSGSQAQLVHAARLDAYGAKRDEARRLLTGDAADEAARTQAVAATDHDLASLRASEAGSLTTSWQAYTAAATQAAATQNGSGGRTAAVNQATGATDSSASTFQTFLATADQSVKRAIIATADAYADATQWLRLACLGVGALALLAAASSWAGISRRLREYREEPSWRR